MYFIVFAAFAIVLSLPDAGPPWVGTMAGWVTFLAVAGQVLAPPLVGWLFSKSVKNKLEREPAWLPSAQARLSAASKFIKIFLVAGLITTNFLTDWARRVNDVAWLSRVWGLDEMVILLPFFTAMILAWVVLYPADKAVRQVGLELRLWASVPARPVWTLRSYLNFMIRQQVLIIALPMLIIVVADDFIRDYRRELIEWSGLVWAPEGLLVVIAGGIFLFAPVMLQYIWQTQVLPTGELRERLEDLCKRIGLRYRRILIWQSDGMVINAAVMGLFRPVRYILLSDGLLEMMEDEKIEAVFGHEAGHVKRHHIQYYLLFAILSMFIVGGLVLLVGWAAMTWPEMFPPQEVTADYLQVGTMLVIVCIWFFGFGYVSRRFEWQADLFGARSITPPDEHCDRPCYYHGTAGSNPDDPRNDADNNSLPSNTSSKSNPHHEAVCARGAEIFADALIRIASLNGIPVEAKSWRHSSISNRISLLRRFAHDPAAVVRFERTVRTIKVILVVGTLIGMAVTTWLYWPF